MNRIALSLIILFILVSSGCDEMQPAEVACFPQRITRMNAEGTKASSVTADFKYEAERLNRIVWSNFQTHYYSYREDGKLEKVERKNVQTYQKHESRIIYGDELVERIDEYRMRLDRFTHEDLDTVQAGYRDFEYDGSKLVAERVYEKADDSEDMELQRYNEYMYDIAGNIVQYVSLEEIGGDTIEAFSYIYDSRRHPFSSLALLFEGESHVNNVLQRTNLQKGVTYFNQIIYTPSSFPEQINVKQEDYLTEVVSIDYTCR
jgi:hypothetical protein